MALLTRSRLAPTMPANSSCVMGSTKLVAVTGNFEEPLGRAAGHIEKDRISEGLIHRTKAAGQQLHHTPHLLGVTSVDLAEWPVGDHDDRRLLQRPCLGRAADAIEEPHLAEEITGLHKGHHRLASIDRFVGDGDSPRNHDVEGIRLLVFAEEHVATTQRSLFGSGNDLLHAVFIEIAKEQSRTEEGGVSHDFPPTLVR